MKNIVILGTAGSSIDILDMINDINLVSPQYNCIGFLDDIPENLGKEHYGVKVLGPLSKAKEMDNTFFINGIGNPMNFWQKESIIEKTQVPLEKFETLIHPTASVSNMTKMGRGIAIFQNATIMSNVTIGNHVLIVAAAVVGHHTLIGDYSCVAGGVCISGGTIIENSCYLGANSSVIRDTRIAKNTLVGMGSNVVKHTEKNSVVYGNPAIFKRNLI